MSDDGDDEIDELRKQTRGTDRISADTGGGSDAEDATKGESKEGQHEEKEQDTEQETEEKEEDEGTDEGARTTKREAPTPSEEFERAFEERAGRTSSAIDPRTVSATDPSLSALLLALQDAGELEAVGDAVADALGAQEPPEYSRDSVVRLAVAYALRETAPGYFEKLAERA